MNITRVRLDQKQFVTLFSLFFFPSSVVAGDIKTFTMMLFFPNSDSISSSEDKSIVPPSSSLN